MVTTNRPHTIRLRINKNDLECQYPSQGAGPIAIHINMRELFQIKSEESTISLECKPKVKESDWAVWLVRSDTNELELGSRSKRKTMQEHKNHTIDNNEAGYKPKIYMQVQNMIEKKRNCSKRPKGKLKNDDKEKSKFEGCLTPHQISIKSKHNLPEKQNGFFFIPRSSQSNKNVTQIPIFTSKYQRKSQSSKSYCNFKESEYGGNISRLPIRRVNGKLGLECGDQNDFGISKKSVELVNPKELQELSGGKYGNPCSVIGKRMKDQFENRDFKQNCDFDKRYLEGVLSIRDRIVNEKYEQVVCNVKKTNTDQDISRKGELTSRSEKNDGLQVNHKTKSVCNIHATVGDGLISDRQKGICKPIKKREEHFGGDRIKTRSEERCYEFLNRKNDESEQGNSEKDCRTNNKKDRKKKDRCNKKRNDCLVSLFGGLINCQKTTNETCKVPKSSCPPAEKISKDENTDNIIASTDGPYLPIDDKNEVKSSNKINESLTPQQCVGVSVQNVCRAQKVDLQKRPPRCPNYVVKKCGCVEVRDAFTGRHIETLHRQLCPQHKYSRMVTTCQKQIYMFDVK